ncbi:2-nitropropane dioxygenase [Cladochytrium replicatum]|nr:2-nitropropane dioxygenase [Cladochytrium replicatum]
MDPQTFGTNLGLGYQVVQAPMAGINTPTLVTAVSNAGALGSLAVGLMSPADIQAAIVYICANTNNPFQLNMFAPNDPELSMEYIPPHEWSKNPFSPQCVVDSKDLAQLDERLNAMRVELGLDPHVTTGPNAVVYKPRGFPFRAQLDAIFASLQEANATDRPIVLSFTFGIPSHSILEEIRVRLPKASVFATATTATELTYIAPLITQNLLDGAIAQGGEAGGHRGSFLPDSFDIAAQLPTQVLAPLACEIFQKISGRGKGCVIAAGGVVDSKGVRAILSLGENIVGVAVGTLFMFAEEAATNNEQRSAMMPADQTQPRTCITRNFTGRCARGIENEFVKKLNGVQIPGYDIQTGRTGDILKTAKESGRPELTSCWAGQGLVRCKEMLRGRTALPASDIVKLLI